MTLLVTTVADPKKRGEGAIPSRRPNAWFLINKRLLTGPQFTTNMSTRSIIWRLESTEISFRPGLRPGPH